MQRGVGLLFVCPVPYSVLRAGEVHVGVIGDQRGQTRLPVRGFAVVTVIVLLQGLVKLVDLTEGQLVVGQEHVSHKKTWGEETQRETRAVRRSEERNAAATHPRRWSYRLRSQTR